MEECEALCTLIAIQVNGTFRCLGSPQHLKSKFGQGFTLIAKMSREEDGGWAPIEPLVAFIQQRYPSATLFDSFEGYAHMQVSDPNVLLADIFAHMERAKRELQVQDYTYQQTSLEQVFLSFTRHQVPERPVKQKWCC